MSCLVWSGLVLCLKRGLACYTRRRWRRRSRIRGRSRSRIHLSVTLHLFYTLLLYFPFSTPTPTPTPLHFLSLSLPPSLYPRSRSRPPSHSRSRPHSPALRCVAVPRLFPASAPRRLECAVCISVSVSVSVSIAISVSVATAGSTTLVAPAELPVRPRKSPSLLYNHHYHHHHNHNHNNNNNYNYNHIYLNTTTPQSRRPAVDPPRATSSPSSRYHPRPCAPRLLAGLLPATRLLQLNSPHPHHSHTRTHTHSLSHPLRPLHDAHHGCLHAARSLARFYLLFLLLHPCLPPEHNVVPRRLPLGAPVQALLGHCPLPVHVRQGQGPRD